MRTTEISRRYEICSAHYLPHVPAGHKCKNLHGHNYGIVVTLKGDIDTRGWLIDFWTLDAIMQPILDMLDHKCLNDVAGLDNPTAENIAHWLFDELEPALALNLENNPPTVSCITIYETPDCSAVVCNNPQE